MKKTIKEAMKHINYLQQQITGIFQDENNNNYVRYSSEDDKEVTDYDFHQVNNQIEKLNKEILKIRSAVNKANQIVKVGVSDYTISDALIRIAQLTTLSDRYEQLARAKQKSRENTYSGVVEYMEHLYDVKEAKKLHLETVEMIHELQTAVDKANILTEIEI